jgi:hypothetical protein
MAVARETGEPLHQLRWAWCEPLELTQRSPYSREHWLLRQARRPIVAIDQTGPRWSLSTAAERWDAAVRRRRRHLGWHLEIAPAGELDPVLYYHPHTLRSGGSLGCAGDGRYRLRCSVLPRGGWVLAAPGGQLAHIKLCARPPGESARARALQAGLVAGASAEPYLLLLLAVASVAIVIHYQQPVNGNI